MFKCNYLGKLNDKTFQKLMKSDQKQMRKRTKFGTNGFVDNRVDTRTGPKFHCSCLNHSYRDVQRFSINLKENLLRS